MKGSIFMRIRKGLILLLLFIPFINVNADDFEVSVNCPNSVARGETFNCTVSVQSSITDFSANYDIDGGNGGTLNLDNKTFSLNIPSDAVSNYEYTINLTNISANSGSLSATDKNTKVRVKSSENRLSMITLSSGNISFNQDTTSYNITVDGSTSSIDITANALDSHATVMGTGTKTLNYGLNSIEIRVKPEIGDTKTYTLNITRTDDRSSVNDLSSLIVTNTNIKFDKNKLEYDLTTKSERVKISATREDNKSTIIGDTGDKLLSYGLNKFSITVISENGSKKTYKINITREDDRSTNNNLKSITLNKGTINFNKNTTTYNVDVENDVDKIKIDAILDDSKSKFSPNYGPREVTLNEGNNTIELRVVSEKGEEKTYTININRKDGRDSDSSLKSVELSDGKIDFKSDKYEYKVNVDYKVEKIEVKAIPTSSKSKVTIEGDGNLDLGNNTIEITVEAENGKKTTYKIVVVRKEKGYEISDNNYIKSLTIKNHSIEFSSDVYRYTINTKEEKLRLSIDLEDSKATYDIKGNNNLKDGSKIVIKVTAENGDVREYIIDIEKPNNTIIIIIMILVTLITIGIIGIVILKIKKRNTVNKSNENKDLIIKEEIEELDDDFSKV